MAIWELDGLAPELAADVGWVAPDAQLIGRVRLASGASVWWGSVLRGDNERIDVGPRSNVQDGCILHTDPGYPLEIAEDVTVGHRVMLHGCRVERGALVGIGATVLNGATIGVGAILGAHALVPEGRVIPPGVLALGVPARVVRALTVEERARLSDSAARYVDNAQRYRGRLRRLPAGDGPTSASS
jgi:carbonic anhydrase/acetyltransferase-like protein (isoleucine patch superfamily)